MVAVVLSILWRQLGSGGTEVSKLLRTEGLLWVPKLHVTQQAISERLRTFPPILFLNTLLHILPVARTRWSMRHRPLPPVLAWANERYTAVLAADGSTLDALLRKVGLLRGQKRHPLAGKMMVLLDVCSWLPLKLWLHNDAKVHDQRFWPQILKAVPEGALLLIDLGFTNFTAFAQAIHFTFVTRLKEKVSFRVTHVLQDSSQVKDLVGWMGSGKTKQRVRVVKVLFEREWYAFLSNELDPTVLPVKYIVGLYFQRWRIEIVCTQMTKLGRLSGFAGWDDVTDLHLVVVNDDTVNEKFYQLPALVECSLFQTLLHPLTECLDRGSDRRHLNSFLSLGLQLTQLCL
jgi:hypothetical protein